MSVQLEIKFLSSIHSTLNVVTEEGENDYHCHIRRANELIMQAIMEQLKQNIHKYSSCSPTES